LVFFLEETSFCVLFSGFFRFLYALFFQSAEGEGTTRGPSTLRDEVISDEIEEESRSTGFVVSNELQDELGGKVFVVSDELKYEWELESWEFALRRLSSFAMIDLILLLNSILECGRRRGPSSESANMDFQLP